MGKELGSLRLIADRSSSHISYISDISSSSSNSDISSSASNSDNSFSSWSSDISPHSQSSQSDRVTVGRPSVEHRDATQRQTIGSQRLRQKHSPRP